MNFKLSPSKLNTFQACPRCFWISVHKKSAPSIPMVLHNMMDYIEKNYYDKHRHEGLPPLLKGKIPGKLVDKELAERIRKYLIWTDEETGSLLRGKMDDCFIDSDGCLSVMDNKTLSGEFKEIRDSYKLQLECYAFLLEKNGHKVGKTGYLIYFVPDKTGDPEKGVKFNTEVKELKLDISRVPEIFKQAVKTASLKSPPKHHEECQTCLWVRDVGEID